MSALVALGVPVRVTSLALVVALASACGGGSPATTPGASPLGQATAAPPTAAATATLPGAETPSPPSDSTPSATPAAPTDASSPGGASPEPAATEPPPTPVAWQELSAATDAPSAREDHTWTPDAAGEAAYLFGGRAGNRASDELWRYDLAADSWTRLEPAGEGPAARFGHVAAWADGVGLVIWSGQVGTDFFSDTWAYDPLANAWRELPSAGDVPDARYGSCGGIGPDGRLWISHGFTADRGRFADTRAYDFAAEAWTEVAFDGPRPVERCLHDCLWTADGRLVLYAGQTTGVAAIGDLWSYDPQAAGWTQADEPEPPARQLYALASVGDTAFVFGGGSADGAMLDDLWLLDLGALSWSPGDVSGSRPSARAGATLLADPARSRLLLFGGTNGDAELSDLWQLSLGAP